MPHARTNSLTSSIYSMMRRSSMLRRHGDSKASMAEESALTTVLTLPTGQHCHMLPAVPVSVRPDDSIVEWVLRVQDARPEVVIATSPKYFVTPEAQLAELEPGTIRFNPSALLLLRVLNTKLYTASERLCNGYQLQVRIGGVEGATLVGASCGSAKSGDLVDSFLIDLNQGVSADDCFIEISVHPHQEVARARGLRKLLGLSSRRPSTLGTEVPDAPAVARLRIPLACAVLSNAGDDRFPRPSGTFYLCEPTAAQVQQEAVFLSGTSGNAGRIVGELTVDVVESPDACQIASQSTASARDAKFSAPLTVLRSEGRVAHWQRITGCLLHRDLVAYDFQRFAGAAPLWVRSLKQAVALDFHRRHPMSIDNVVEITFGGGEKMFAYADSEQTGLVWADKLSMAIWGQPYAVEASCQ